ncbi:uncharacterized protein TRIADDRAFT_53909 [Trichoplax adhaerens]|uniref:26S proteasome regulatory subunit RPN3 n=1 Tax=Trichoplax adhaerens TaxID=10228 RepID=B3RMD4_TRIAD|nr:hypothetical protein TRIADDRAFT_53909 [Trichoplax adhaerens]EDV28345.1 hypothetical protein TRIADDRAFT_53909 [Trichoplax adhaerens]|eukprot:XP_002110179.1 hypothetical protein TRIADDRAFT_53909 [Trichoplax adhaerens]
MTMSSTKDDKPQEKHPTEDANKKDPKVDQRREEERIFGEDIQEHAKYIERSVKTMESRYVARILRTIKGIRSKASDNLLRKAINKHLATDSPSKDRLLSFLDESMDIAEEGGDTVVEVRHKKTDLLEIEIYLHLLVLMHLLDSKRYDKAIACADLLIEKCEVNTKHSLDLLSAKCYYYYSRAYELSDRLRDIRSKLLARLRTCTIRHDEEGQAVLINLLLQNYLHYNLYDQANKLVSKAAFPEAASNNEWARHFFYLGRIRAIELNYSDAYQHLLQVHKFAIVVQLLLGEIPDRSIFRDRCLRRPLLPYFQLTQAVRNGDLARFNVVVDKFKSRFLANKTYTLIIRLRHNVIKTGVRMINISYSSISLEDIAKKLQLDSREDAEYIVAKAIKDGVIDAVINHESGTVESKENVDIYSTNQPQEVFNQRTSFCLQVYNQSVKAMRYPRKTYSDNVESAEGRREREQHDLELAKEMADKDDDF